MSWQHVLEFARKQGIPVVVTDPAGREPMVVLPLSAYEGMTEVRKVPEESIRIPITVPSEPTNTPIVNQGFESSAPPQHVDEMVAMEERFYLEPTDEPNGP